MKSPKTVFENLDLLGVSFLDPGPSQGHPLGKRDSTC